MVNIFLENRGQSLKVIRVASDASANNDKSNKERAQRRAKEKKKKKGLLAGRGNGGHLKRFEIPRTDVSSFRACGFIIHSCLRLPNPRGGIQFENSSTEEQCLKRTKQRDLLLAAESRSIRLAWNL